MSVATRLSDLQCGLLKLEVRDAILTVVIDRPEALNALSPQVISELREVFGALRSALGEPGDDGEPDWSIRGVIVTGGGPKSFVAGADIAAMNAMSGGEVRRFAAEAQELTGWIETLPVPVIAAVNGFALGGGCEFAMACDVIYASENASFSQPEVALGLIPGFGGCVRLQKYVGPGLARELIMTGRRIGADEARSIGLVARVLPDAEALLEAARETIGLAMAQSPVAVGLSKRTIRQVEALPTDEGLAAELDAFASCFGTGDQVEGTAAFVEKRRPRFPGR